MEALRAQQERTDQVARGSVCTWAGRARQRSEVRQWICLPHGRLAQRRVRAHQWNRRAGDKRSSGAADAHRDAHLNELGLPRVAALSAQKTCANFFQTGASRQAVLFGLKFCDWKFIHKCEDLMGQYIINIHIIK